MTAELFSKKNCDFRSDTNNFHNRSFMQVLKANDMQRLKTKSIIIIAGLHALK
jgi:hypothetical protein